MLFPYQSISEVTGGNVASEGIVCCGLSNGEAVKALTVPFSTSIEFYCVFLWMSALKFCVLQFF